MPALSIKNVRLSIRLTVASVQAATEKRATNISVRILAHAKVTS
jgi:hypothetical protein